MSSASICQMQKRGDELHGQDELRVVVCNQGWGDANITEHQNYAKVFSDKLLPIL